MLQFLPFRAVPLSHTSQTEEDLAPVGNEGRDHDPNKESVVGVESFLDSLGVASGAARKLEATS